MMKRRLLSLCLAVMLFTGCGITASAEDTGENQMLDTDQFTVKVWRDDFDGESLNQNIWGYELGNVRGVEQQHYVDDPENVYLEDGNLVLQITDRAPKDQYKSPRGNRMVCYNSGSIRTVGKVEFLYGKLEIRAKLPEGKGAFPAFWTLGADFTLNSDVNLTQGYQWPMCGEIDMMEMVGAPTEERTKWGETPSDGTSNSTVYGTPHWYTPNVPDFDASYAPTRSGASITLPNNLSEDYHTYGINWSPDKIEWYVDNEIYNSIDLTRTDEDGRWKEAAAAFCRPQYIQLNLAAGGNWAGDAGEYLGEDNTRFIIDYVSWEQTPEQQAAMEEYYKTQPVIDGVEDITMVKGSGTTGEDLVKNLTVGNVPEDADYTVDFSIENEYSFTSSGGQTNTTCVNTGLKDTRSLDDLAPGLYNIYYTAMPQAFLDAKGGQNVSYGKLQSAGEYKLARRQALLVVLPEELTGVMGQPLSSIALPEGFSWADPDAPLTGDKAEVIYTKTDGFRQTPAIVTVKAAEFEPGDVNQDGDVAVPDALAALRAAVGLDALTGNAFNAADMDHSGDITVSDALQILRMAVGLA